MHKALTVRQEEQLQLELINWLDQLGYRTSQILYDENLRAYIPTFDHEGNESKLDIPERYQQIA